MLSEFCWYLGDRTKEFFHLLISWHRTASFHFDCSAFISPLKKWKKFLFYQNKIYQLSGNGISSLLSRGDNHGSYVEKPDLIIHGQSFSPKLRKSFMDHTIYCKTLEEIWSLGRGVSCCAYLSQRSTGTVFPACASQFHIWGDLMPWVLARRWWCWKIGCLTFQSFPWWGKLLDSRVQ